MTVDEVILQLENLSKECPDNCNNGYCQDCILNMLCCKLENVTLNYLVNIIKNQQAEITKLICELSYEKKANETIPIMNKLVNDSAKQIQQLKAQHPVKCYECKYGKPFPGDFTGIECFNPHWGGRDSNIYMDIDSFCSYGKRKESEVKADD